MAGIVTDALVLRRADWRDYDRMITLLTPSGRVDAIARGCRKPKSPLLAAAEPFTAGEYVLYSTGGRNAVAQFHATDTFYPLREDYEKLIHGAYWLKLLEMQAVPNQSAEGMFQLALRALAHLAYSDLAPAVVTMAFELHYLDLLGMAPRMDSCVRCGRLVDGDAWFDAEGGGTVCAACRRTLPEITNGACRILMRVPMMRFDAVMKLPGHPNLLEAERCARLFLTRRMDIDPLKTPDIVETVET